MRLLLQLSDLTAAAAVTFGLNGSTVTVPDGTSLLHALREDLHCRSVKDGCSPQGQCGCCTVWVDGAARVACVTPVRRVAGREVTTVEGLSPDVASRWADAFVARGASQCGFCTPGIVLRLAALESGSRPVSRQAVESALLAHLCRCTGWQSIVEAGCVALGIDGGGGALSADRDPLRSSWRAELEGGSLQTSGPEVVLGGGGFADDGAPTGALVHLGPLRAGSEGDGLAVDLRQAMAGSGKVQGRNSTVPLTHPVAVPDPGSDGEWALTLQTTWVEPAYVEPDASWCRPGGEPASPLANGGAFGGKVSSSVADSARVLSDRADSAIRIVWSREDVVRHGPKRPPLALGLRADGTGCVRVGHTPGSGDLAGALARVQRLAPGVVVEELDIAGPPLSADLRGAVWAEVVAAQAVLRDGGAAGVPGVGRADIVLPERGRAVVEVDTAGPGVSVEVWAGEVLCEVTLRSYVIGAVHQALGMVWSEGIAVDEHGHPLDLTIRSFGILAARDMPAVDVVLHQGDTWPVPVSDAVFTATLAAAWMAEGRPGRWPTRRVRTGSARMARREESP